MRQHYLSIHSLKKILKKLLFFKAGLAQLVWVAKWQVPSADHTPPSFQFLFPDRICQLFWDFLFSLTYQILIPVLSPRHSKKTDETVEHVIFLMQNFQCLDFFVDAVVLEWKSKFYILIYLDFMRDLILFSEIYNLIFLVYNAFIRHKQHSFLHDKRTSGNSVQD